MLRQAAMTAHVHSGLFAAAQKAGSNSYSSPSANVDSAGETIRVFIVAVAHTLQMYPRTESGAGWRMTPAHLAKYALDPDVMTFELYVKDGRWWQPAG